MTKTAKIIIAIIALLLVAGGGYYAYKNKPSAAPAMPDTQNGTATNPALDPISGQTVSDKIPQTNPFQTQVSPYDAYKNPFNQ